MNQDLFLNIEQIIPTPEAKELMIGINAKEADEKHVEAELKNRHKLRLAFWEKTLDALSGSQCDLFNNINPSKDHWLSAGSGMRACPFTLIFGVKEVRVELGISRSNTEENKYIFDALKQQKSTIEQSFGEALQWQRLDNKKASRIQFNQSVVGYNKENWPDMIQWLVTHITKLESALKKPLKQVNQKLKHNQTHRQNEQ
jgi:hypothetical protein